MIGRERGIDFLAAESSASENPEELLDQVRRACPERGDATLQNSRTWRVALCLLCELATRGPPFVVFDEFSFLCGVERCRPLDCYDAARFLLADQEDGQRYGARDLLCASGLFGGSGRYLDAIGTRRPLAVQFARLVLDPLGVFHWREQPRLMPFSAGRFTPRLRDLAQERGAALVGREELFRGLPVASPGRD